MLSAMLLAGGILFSFNWGALEEDGVDAALEELQAQEASFEGRLSRVVQDGLGTTYVGGPLGEGAVGKYDTDPLMDLSKVDCVTYVEQCIALAASRNYGDAFALLQEIRYAEGKINYEARNHFFVSDWLKENSWCSPISEKLGVEHATVKRTISRKDYFQLVKAPTLGQETPDQEITLSYVPVEKVAQAASQLKAPTLVVFIGKKPTWLFALHTGIYLPGESGAGKLYHASSKAKEVVAVDLPKYVEEQATRYLGVAFYNIGVPKW